MSQVVAGSKKGDPLRQQLDELDHLMQRMLALGVNQAPVESGAGSPRNPPAIESVEERLPDAAPLVASQESAPGLVEFGSSAAAVPYHPEFDLHPAQVESGAPVLAESEPAIVLVLPAPTFVALGSSADSAAAPLFADFQFANPTYPESAREPATQPELGLEAPLTEPFADFQFAPPPSELAMEPVAARVSIPVTVPPAPTVLVAWWLQPLAIVNRIYDGSTVWLGPIGRGLRSGPMRNLLGICGLAALIGALAWMLWEGTDWNS